MVAIDGVETRRSEDGICISAKMNLPSFVRQGSVSVLIVGAPLLLAVIALTVDPLPEVTQAVSVIFGILILFLVLLTFGLVICERPLVKSILIDVAEDRCMLKAFPFNRSFRLSDAVVSVDAIPCGKDGRAVVLSLATGKRVSQLHLAHFSYHQTHRLPSPKQLECFAREIVDVVQRPIAVTHPDLQDALWVAPMAGSGARGQFVASR